MKTTHSTLTSATSSSLDTKYDSARLRACRISAPTLGGLLVLLASLGCGFVLSAATGSGTTPTPTAPTPAPPPAAPAQRSAAELEKLAMPIALHPDPLVAIILPAAVYPVEIVQAARFVKDTNNIPKVDQQPWDENVKAVAKIPDLIAKLDADLEWTVQLGQAFLDQPKELMDTIQSLRAKAQKAGTLQTTPQQIVTVTNVVVLQTNVTQVVTVTNQIVQVQPANPQVIYVPTYPPTVYYPPPGYVYNPLAPLVSFGVAVGIGAIIANNCDWHGGCVWWGGGYHGDVDIDVDIDRTVNRGDRPASQSGNRAANTGAKPTQQKWQPDQGRLNKSGATSPATREARGWSSASTQPAQRPATGAAAARPAQQPSAGAGAARPAQQPTYNFSQPPSAGTQPARSPGAGQTAAQRPASPTTGARPSTAQQPAARPAQSPTASRPAASPAASARPAQSPSVSRPSAQPSSAFGGVSSGSTARSASSRGAVSRGGGGGRGR